MNPTSKNRFCPNCYHPLEESAAFCGHCGQKYTTGKVSVLSLIREFIDNFVALDSSVLRSVPLLLFKPGQLTLEFFKGKHKNYVRPIRLFLFTTLIFFAFLTFYTGGFSNLQGEFAEGTKLKVEKQKQYNGMVSDIDSAIIDLKKKVPITSHSEIDSAFKHFEPKAIIDTMPVMRAIFTDRDKNDIKIAYEDLFYLSPDEIIEKYNLNPRNKWERIIQRKIIKIQKDGGSFLNYLFSRLSWLIFIMVPFFALVLKGLYFFSNRYYVEHLVFGLHFHSFVFICGIAMLLLIPVNTALWTPVLCLAICVYLFLAMRRYYKQGFWKTLFKYGLLCFSFLFVIVLSSVMLIFIGAALF